MKTRQLRNHWGRYAFHTDSVGIDQLVTPITGEGQDDDPDHTKTEGQKADFFELSPPQDETQP
ncbi:MAG: hypothetical protein ABI988_16500 [Nitrospirota bacterium]